MTDYVTADQVQTYLRIADDNDVQLIQSLVTTASRMIDEYCGRQFSQDTTVSARVYQTSHVDLISTDDISTTTGLIVKTDNDNDGVYENTWAATDYQLEPLNWLAQGKAVYTIRSTGRNFWFPVWHQTSAVQVTAKWGWPSVPDQVAQACLLQVARLHMRRQSPGGMIIVPDLSVERLYASIDPDARVLLDPFKRGEWLP
jgi:hypothetical protein